MSSALDLVATGLFLLSFGALFYVYIGYPVLLSVIGFFFKRRQAELGYFPTVSVLIAAYNEEGGIRKKIEQTLELDYPSDKIEIIVLSDCSTDHTDEIVKSFTDSRVRLFRAPQRKGKTNAQNLGVEVANGEVLIFSDATTVYHPLALQYLACNYADLKVGAVSGRYQYFDPDGKSPTGSGMIAFWNYENLIKMMQSRIRTISGCCGCIYSVRKAAYTPLHPGVISDLVQPLWAIQKGYRVVFEDRALAYEETTKSSKEEFSMRVRVVTRGIRGILSVADLLNPAKYGWVSFQLFSHKILRWMVPFFLLLLFASNAVLWNHPGYAWLFAAQTAFYGFALLTLLVPLHRIWKPFGIPLYFCTLNAAALRSVVEVLRGRNYVVWETVRS
jgi:cellulose synthase/poly-beta-1,6-N-acetylglucosamine synthase-like glycosyltransferase